MKILIRWLVAALFALSTTLVVAQQNPLPCVAGSPTQKYDEAIWKKVREIDHVVAYARYVRMFTACHGETAIRRIRELQDEAIRTFTFSIQESGHTDVLTAGNGDALGNAARTTTLLMVKGRFNTSMSAGSDGQPAATLKYRCTYWTANPATIEATDRRDGEDCGWIPDAANKPALNMMSVSFFTSGRIGIRENGDNVTLQINNTFSYGNLNCVGNKQAVGIPDNKDSDLEDPALRWPAKNVVTRQSFDECTGFARPWTPTALKADAAKSEKTAKADRPAKAAKKKRAS